ncbi:hypothetical protein FPHYL_6791 [Fusarium phyllophilum]|uniref:Uncharacterized protein n=1 Tax=Fusarium phyllophilum TaxID=47803 RepID=A0A8H5NCJ8_9HYPO|nr:hypothetical protein FPHYL_6791 [Fusarium phyllophilum]
MANPQLGRHQDDGEELGCLRQTQSRRAQTLLGRYLWSEIEEVETSDLRVTTPVAECNNHLKEQPRPHREYARDDMGICTLPEQAVNSKYEIPPRRCRTRLSASVSPSKCVNNDSPSTTPKRLAEDTARNDSLPIPAPGSESKLMRQPDRPISHDQLVAEVKSIYAGLVMVESKCLEVDKAHSTEEHLTPEEWHWHQFIASQRRFFPENGGPFNLPSPKTSQDHELGALLSEVCLRSRSFCRLNSRLQPLLQATKGPPSCVRFVEFLTLIGALSDILSKYSSLVDFTDTILTGLFDLITNASTQIVFEFPNNVRHVCTTMPWTILPALLVLWGVCWMFIIGPGDLEPEKFLAPVPTFSPAPAAYDFLDNSAPAYYDFGLQSGFMPEPSTTSFEQRPTIDSLLLDNDGVSIDPEYLFQAAPQGPDFLSLGVLPMNSAGITEKSAKEDLTGALPAAVTPDPILQTYRDTNRQETFNPMVNVASVGQGVKNTGQKRTRMQHPALKSRFHARTEAARGPREGLPSNAFTT